MKILVINAGSSSLKFQLIDMENEKLLAKGLVERIGFTGFDVDNFSQKVGEKKVSLHKILKDHKEAFELVIKELTDPEHGAIKDMSSIGAVGHRVLHGGAVETQNDHRLAMSAAVAACAATGEVTVDNDACVAKSYPRFWEDYGSLKGEGL